MNGFVPGSSLCPHLNSSSPFLCEISPQISLLASLHVRYGVCNHTL